MTEEPQERYEGHGDLELTRAERKLLSLAGFLRWGDAHGWVRFVDGDEQGGTCYDDKWAVREALKS